MANTRVPSRDIGLALAAAERQAADFEGGGTGPRIRTTPATGRGVQHLQEAFQSRDSGEYAVPQVTPASARSAGRRRHRGELSVASVRPLVALRLRCLVAQSDEGDLTPVWLANRDTITVRWLSPTHCRVVIIQAPRQTLWAVDPPPCLTRVALRRRRTNPSS